MHRNAQKTTCPKGHPYDSADSKGRRCSVCDREAKQRYSQTHDRREYHQQHNQKAEVKARKRDEYLRRTYGITLVEEQAMIAQQNGLCACCGGPPTDHRGLVVDHCHRSGKIRGMLCDRCNRALGVVDDDPALLRKLISFVTDR